MKISRSICALLALALVLPVSSSAAPKWLKRTVEVAIYVAPVATSLLATHEAHLCRQRSGVAPCSGGYGPFAAREGLRGGVSITFSGLSMWGHKEGYKEWFVPAVGISAFNSFVAMHQSGIHVEKEKE